MNYKIGLAILIALVALIILGRYAIAHPAIQEVEASGSVVEIITTPAPSLTPSPPPINKSVREEIINVFGEHSSDAFLLLEGKGEGTCAENRLLDPNAINTNNDGSRDFGAFQLNDNWHGFKRAINNERYLLDPAINIRIAYRLFKESGDSFKLWTCGKKYGI